MEWLTSMCFGYVVDAGLVIKEGGVVVPSEQQGTGFQSNCTSSLYLGRLWGKKNDAGGSVGRQIFLGDCGLSTAVWAPQLNVSLI